MAFSLMRLLGSSPVWLASSGESAHRLQDRGASRHSKHKP
jgi:hypothetical protein